MKLHVGWVEQGTYGLHTKVVDGGCWGLFTSNNRLFMKPVQYGKHDRTKQQLEAMAYAWNMWASELKVKA
jgi:hypothetical protein